MTRPASPFRRLAGALLAPVLVPVLLLGAPGAAALDMGLVTGGPTGTYVQIGADIARVVEDVGLDVEVIESAGSLENVYALRYTPGVQIGLVQADILGFLRARAEGVVTEPLTARERADLRGLIDSLRLVHPLYLEEVHLLARREIASVEALAGRRVSFGRIGSGTFITAEQVFRGLGIAVEPVHDIAPGDAVAALRAGEIDAMVYVVGQPARLFADRPDLGAAFHFLDLQRPGLLESYDPVRIERASYPWIAADVATVGVRSLLVAYDYEHPENCDAIGRIAAAIGAGLGELRQRGHAKWQGVALDARVSDWERYRCAAPESARGTTATAAEPGAAEPGPVDALIQNLRR